MCQKNHYYRNCFVRQGKVKNSSSIRESCVRVETNNTEHPQLNTLSQNKLLSLNKSHHHSFSTSSSYATSSFNFIYKLLTWSFDGNISKSRVSGVNNKVSARADKVVSNN